MSDNSNNKKKNYAPSELTPEVLAAFETDLERVQAVVSALPALVANNEALIKVVETSKLRVLLNHTDEKDNTLQTVCQLRVDLGERAQQFDRFAAILQAYIQQHGTKLMASQQKCMQMFRELAGKEKTLIFPVHKNHRKEFYDLFISLLMPYRAEKDPRSVATLSEIKNYCLSTNKDWILGNGYLATQIMIDVAGAEAVPEWIKNFYCVDYNPPPRPLYQKYQEEEEKKQSSPKAAASAPVDPVAPAVAPAAEEIKPVTAV